MLRNRLQKTLPLVLVLLASSGSAQLDLPGKRPARPEDPAAELIPPRPRPGDLAAPVQPLDLPREGPVPGPSATPPGASASAARDDARRIFEELARAASIAAVAPAMRRLQPLGPEVLVEARARLDSQRAPELLAAALACLSLGSSADRAAVAERLTRPLPGPVAGPLLDELLARDPVIVSPEYLARLLGHDSSALRNQAHRALEARLSPALLPHLAAVLENPRTSTRLLALDLVARCQDPAARNLLASRLGDPSAEVADRACGWLATDPQAEALLLERALGAGAPAERGQAYALLALIRRQENTGAILLGPEHVAALREGLQSPLAIVAGACAVALARIGFRAPSADTSGWLDREVPHWLVRYGTGAVFHPDFSTLQGPALRAFALLTGQRFATGEEARRWWAENASGFRARRGVIEPEAGAELGLVVEFDAGRGRWALVGPEADGSAAPRELFLDQAQALRTLKGLQSRGLLSLERPPTAPPLGGERFLELRLGRDRKVFAYPAASVPAWLTESLTELEALVEAGRWQLFHDPRQSQREAWLERRGMFSEETAPRERERAFKDLVLELARGTPLELRTPLVAELERLYDRPGVPEGRDLVPWLALLEDEPRFELRSARLLELARVAAGAAAREAPAAPGAPSPARRVLERALERFGSAAAVAVASLARDLDPEERRELARDARPAARAAAGRALFASLDPAERSLALELLEDPEPEVSGAILDALVERPVPEARAALTGRAQAGPVEQRAQALRALGRLGGEGVYDLALLALAEPQPELQRASVEALAELADERAASLLSSLLVRGPSSPLYAPARRGLGRMGEAGISEGLRLAGSSSARTRREAALFLAENLRPEALRVLLTLYSEDPGDEALAWELAVLSAIDLRGAPDPVRAWWEWWDQVVHDDAWAWFLAATERQGRPGPARTAFQDGGTPEAARYLLSLLELSEPCLVERAARELERLLGRESPAVRDAAGPGWRAELKAAVEARFER